MTRPVTIALDAMGGDHGPAIVIPGAALTLERRPDARFVVFGDEGEVLPLLDQHPALKAVTTFHHTEVSVKMDDKPSQALRYGRYKSSMWRAIDATKTGEADVTVSAGNTGALMAMSKFCLKSMPEVDRRRSPASGRRCAARASCSMSGRPSAPMPAISSISP